MKKQNKIIFNKITLFIGLLLIFAIIFLGIFYFCSSLNNFTKSFFKTIPYPIALINKNKILTTRDILSNAESLERFYVSQDFSEIGMRIDFKTEEGKQRLKIKEKEIFNKLIEDEIIKLIAESKGINISQKEAEQELIAKTQAAGSTENLALNLKKLYNWKLSDFRDKVILPKLYLEALISYYEKEIASDDLIGSEIEKAYQELKNGINFEKVASKYSQGETAKNGGSLGWFKKEYLVEPIAEKAYSMEPGEFSEVIQSSLGSHLIYLEEVKEKEGIKEVKLKQIFTPEGSFLNWFNDQKATFSIKIFLKEYFWDEESLKIKFSNSTLENNENILRNKSEGDPSIY